MSYWAQKDYFTEVKRGNVPGHSLIHKFGKNDAIGTAFTLISIGGTYPTPAANVALQIVSDDAADDIASTGARKVTIQGLTFSGGLLIPAEEEVEMDGLTPVALTIEYARIFRAWISESGVYVGPGTVSSPGTITIDEVVGGADWLVIAEFATGNSAGQSQTALYTTPSNTTSVLYAPNFTIEASKDVDVAMFHRPNADDVSTPYSGARRLIHEWVGLQIPNGTGFMVPVSAFTGATDIGFMAKVALNTAHVSAEFWLLQIDD